MRQMTQGRRIAINILVLLSYVVVGFYFHNVLESIIVGVLILCLANFAFDKKLRKSVKPDN